ncbi:hypothetical protein M1L60_42585 [Actinoplanes sp. TRM 88003]|uniref:Uncharacterized protein n=1 Tax=Paractinoplanes aksuensis TaxID=2939490 RepID=A0ABT1E553_9ACTN|nr:hypothetical protein [Actinoplanes aksuensis]MCO8277285.1 hypothetical protein [Actinoplanes aksuensis]
MKNSLWLRRIVLGLACLPLATISVLHTMGRTDDFGILGEWYVMLPLAAAGFLAWTLIEKAWIRVDEASAEVAASPGATAADHQG